MINILPAGAHFVFEIVQDGNQSVICSAADPYIQINQPGSIPGCWGHTDGSMNSNKTFYFVYERHSMCKQFASL